MGSVYLVFRRGVLWYGNFNTKQEDLAKSMKRLFMQFRPYLLMIHKIFMILATIAAFIHGFTLEREVATNSLFGWVAAIIMAVLSTLGILMWTQLRPILKKIDMYIPIRFIHRQWILSVILAIFLGIHLIV